MIKKTKKIINKVHFLKIQKNKGYALLETIFYIVLFAIFSVAVINAMLTMTQSFKETAIQKELMQGSNILERISREIRNAYAVNSISANSLKLNTTDDLGVNKIIEFSLSGSDIRLLEDDVFIGNLNSSNITVVNLAFTQINTTNSIAIKIFLTVRSNHDTQNREENFYDTVVFRGSY